MTGERYTVQSGDSLWRIAHAKLGDGHQWKRLWRYNNRTDVMKVTGRGIPDADLIYPGQMLLLPVLPAGQTSLQAPSAPPATPAARPSAQPLRTPPPSAAPGPRLPRITDVESPISIKYRLDDLKLPPMIQPGGVVEMKMTGDVILTSRKTYPAAYVTQRREIETQAVAAANHAFGSLFTDTRLIYDAAGHKMTYRSMLVTQSNVPNAMAAAVGVQMDSNGPIPKLRFEFRFAKLEGTIADFRFVGLDVKVVVELTPTPQRPGPSAQPLRAPQPAAEWRTVIGTGLLVIGAAIVIGTLVEDFFTAGAGVADDPASFAAAAASLGRGLQLIRGTAAVLPAAAVPAVLNMSMRLEPAAPGTIVAPPR